MSKWYKASELERLNTPMPMDGVNGLPDNHVITVSERVVEIDEPELVQNNVSTDTFTLELDAEWDDITPVVIFSNSNGDYKVAYENGPTKIPAAAMAVIGSVDVSVFGLDSTGEVRVVTKAAPNTMDVVESGKFVGEVSEDDISLLGQILAAVEAANEAAKNANATIIKSAVATTLNPGEPATANLADNVLTIGVPKGEKGDKGNPGQDGVTPFTQAAVTTLEPGAPATVAIEEDTLKLGIPKGEKGDKGDQGDKGETGDKGYPGTAATISVGSVKGLDAGASPTVVNSGTSTEARFDFGIPKGDKGDTGDPGHTPQRGVDYWTAEDVETVVEDAKARAVAEMAEIGNVPKGTVTDLVAHAEDAYAQKPVEVRIKGKTWVNRWPKINTMEKGLTVATADTGIITLSGQNTASDNSFPYISVEGVAAGRQYILMTSSITGMTTETFYIYAQAHGADDGYLQSFTLATETTKTITLPAGTTRLRCGFIIRSGQSANWSGRIMLVEGTEAPDCFTPPASITSVQAGNLVTSGKNLLQRLWSGLPHADRGITFSDNGDGGIKISGTATDDAYFNFFDSSSNRVQKLPSGDYAITLKGQVKGTGFSCGYFNNVQTNDYASWLTTNESRPIGSGILATTKYIRPYLFVKNGTTVNVVVYPQLELSSTATAYEPPNITTTPLPEVELRSLPNGTCDELVIKADGTCEVKRRLAQRTIDAEHPVNIASFVPAAGTDLPYVAVDMFAPFDSYLCDVSKNVVSTSWPFTENLKSRGVYRTWDMLIFVDERFTDKETAKSIINEVGGTFVTHVPPSTEPQSHVTLPVLPAPTFNVYHDSDVPSDTSTTYARDINIALADLEAKIADLVTKEAANV